MKNIAIGVAVTLVAASVQAQTEASDSLDDYLFQIRARYATSVSKLGSAMPDADPRGIKDVERATGSDSDSPEAYVSSSAAEVAAMYQLALKTSTNNRKAQGLLNELQEYWVASMTEVVPGAAEKRREYDRRTAETNRRLKDLANSVVVEACKQQFYCITARMRRLKPLDDPS